MKNLNEKLFPKFWEAVEAMAKCCDIDKPVLSKSEVFNETWMLRLTLALIHDYDDNKNFCPLPNDANDKKKKALARIRTAVKRRWISEGGLTAAFENEGATWADAIVGNVKLDDSKAKPKRGVAIDIDVDKSSSKSIVVIEAKMNSALASGITHASDYNQAARNIACLAMLIKDNEDLKKNSSFIVFAPMNKLEQWCNGSNNTTLEKSSKTNPQKMNPQKMIDEAWETINKQFKKREKQCKRGGKDPARTLKAAIKESDIKPIVENSTVISWEEVIQSMANYQNGSYEILKRFYEQTCNEYGIEPLWNKG